MKKSVLLLGLVVVVAVGISVQSCSREPAVGGVPSKAVAPPKISRDFNIAGGSVQTVSFAAPAVPGTLTGKWRATGSAGNDTLSGFTLTDPSDAVLDSSFKGSSGSFNVKVSAAGTHTFFFENAGAKQTPRRVLLDAEFKPD